MEPDTVNSNDNATSSKSTVVEKTRDKWDKLDIILKFIGALGTAVVIGLVGFMGSNWLAKRQEQETNLRLYTELMTKREEADTSLRKEMFNSIITNFLKPGSAELPDKKVLNLELLAYNFHDSLDLAPLFKDVNRSLEEKRANQPFIDRLAKVAQDVIAKQVAMLSEAGGKVDGTIPFDALQEERGGVVVMDDDIAIDSKDELGQPIKIHKKVRIEALSRNLARREVEVRLIVTNESGHDEADAAFTVDAFDFPMLDNVRLPGAYRCAIVLNTFDAESADFTFVYFPSDRAGLKEKPYYDEIIHNLRPAMR